jgi:hypothetical protein
VWFRRLPILAKIVVALIFLPLALALWVWRRPWLLLERQVIIAIMAVLWCVGVFPWAPGDGRLVQEAGRRSWRKRLGAPGEIRTPDLRFRRPPRAIITRRSRLARISHNPCTAATFCPQSLSLVAPYDGPVSARPVDKSVDTVVDETGARSLRCRAPRPPNYRGRAGRQ